MDEDKCPCCGVDPCIHNEVEKAVDYRLCIKNLLDGLEVQEINLFMKTINPERCRDLGRAITERTKVLLYQRSILNNQQALFDKALEHANTPS